MTVSSPAVAPATPTAPALPADPRPALVDVGALFYERGWSYGTSSNYSVVLQRQPLRILITASGKDKRSLTTDDFVIVDETGQAIVTTGGKPSAETMLHVALAQCFPTVGSVLHTHSLWGTVLSERHFPSGGLTIAGYEMLKGLEGVTTHEHTEWVEIFDNSQDIPALAEEVKHRLADTSKPPLHGFLLRGHGLYTWGRTLNEARRHVEILEFLFTVLGHTR
jgi:methylthioribulose-1-phosphate dehydratase